MNTDFEILKYIKNHFNMPTLVHFESSVEGQYQKLNIESELSYIKPNILYKIMYLDSK